MKEKEIDKVPSVAPFGWLMIGIVVIFVLFGFAVVWGIGSWEHRGLFGDMFGALNTLFSGAAFAGVVYAIILQRRELAMQREEMRLSREELAAHLFLFIMCSAVFGE